MSSLYSLLRKGKRTRPKISEERRDWFDAVEKVCLENARPPNCILVNVQNVVEDFKEGRAFASDDLYDIPFITPPFWNMWLEFEFWNTRFAVHVGRTEEIPDDHLNWMRDRNIVMKPYKHFCQAEIWTGFQGQILGPIEIYEFLTNADDGALMRGSCSHVMLAEIRKGYENAAPDISHRIGIVALTGLSRMNCKNVELRPINEGKFRPHAPNKVVPASVWHEIVITGVPKIRSGGRDIFEKDEHEIRAHWIRGHYADYRRGAGLFGNPKLRCLFWIPEHRRGNEELGQVIPEYTIQ